MKQTFKNVMSRAWEICRNAAAKFGGSVKLYLKEAMVLAWSEHKMGVIVSASVEIKPFDNRCRYWAKIVRNGSYLPLPSNVDGAGDVPAPYAKRGDDELFPGDFLIEGEETHHIKSRGWDYWITWCDSEGKLRRIKNPGTEVKAEIKANSGRKELLAGSGYLAAVVRVAHALVDGVLPNTFGSVINVD